jgi:hypothetical protein
MYPMPGNCPVCGDTFTVTRLQCPTCDTSLEGRFILGRLSRLNADQLSFVETFLRCEGTLKRVEKELGISYPTVRARLEDVIRGMGFEVLSDYVAQPSGLSDAERREILDRLDRGEIASEEALALLRGEL